MNVETRLATLREGLLEVSREYGEAAIRYDAGGDAMNSILSRLGEGLVASMADDVVSPDSDGIIKRDPWSDGITDLRRSLDVLDEGVEQAIVGAFTEAFGPPEDEQVIVRIRELARSAKTEISERVEAVVTSIPEPSPTPTP